MSVPYCFLALLQPRPRSSCPPHLTHPLPARPAPPHLTPRPLPPVILDYLSSKRISSGDLVVVSPDVGGVARARAFAKKLNDAPLAIVDKRRSAHNVSEVMNLIGDVRGKVAVLVDDMIDTAGELGCGVVGGGWGGVVVRALPTVWGWWVGVRCRGEGSGPEVRAWQQVEEQQQQQQQQARRLPGWRRASRPARQTAAHPAARPPSLSLPLCRLPAGTITNAAKVLHVEGAREVYACATHAVFSPPAVERLSSGVFQEVIVANTIPLLPENQFPELTVLSGAAARGEAGWLGRLGGWGRWWALGRPLAGRWLAGEAGGRADVGVWPS